MKEFLLSSGHPIQPGPRQIGTLSDVWEWLRRGETVAFSIAPTFAGYVGADAVDDWVGRLYEVGADRVEETVTVLNQVAEMRLRAVQSRRGWLTSCPRATRLLKAKGLSEQQLAVPTPMGLHARRMRQELSSGAKVTFIGPCRHKRYEAQEDAEGPDAVLTFRELTRWLAPVVATPREFASPAPYESRLAPLVRGVSGLRQVSRLVGSGPDAMGAFELLGCKGGCLAGPSPLTDASFSERQRQMLEFADRVKDSSSSPA